MTRQTVKYALLLIIIGILVYRFTEHPPLFYDFFDFIGRLFRPFFLGALLAILMNPVVCWLRQCFNFPIGLSLFGAYLLGLFLILICFLLVVPSFIVGVTDVFFKVSTFLSRVEEKEWLDQVVNQTPYMEELIIYLQENVHNLTKNLILLLNNLSTSIVNTILGFASELFNCFLGITISIYLLLDQKKVFRSIERFFRAYFPLYEKRILYFLKFTYRTFQDYMIGRILDSFIIGLIAFVGFYFLNIPYVALFAFIIFITNIIPYFGPIIGAIFPIAMTLLVNPMQAVWVALFILLLQQLDGNVIGAKIMGDCVGLSPLWVISVVILGGAIFGFVGFFLAVPVSAVIKEVYELLLNERLEQIKQLNE